MRKIAVLLAALMLVCTLASCAVISGPEQTHEVFELSTLLFMLLIERSQTW